MDDRLPDTQTVYAGWLKVVVLTLRTDAGKTVKREVVERGDAACVLPYDPERRTALLVRLPRPGSLLVGGPERLLEAPAGMLDGGETGEAAARREAEEETGLKLGALEPVARTWPSPGASSERIALFLAPYSAADRQGVGGGAAGEHEDIEVVELRLSELRDLARRGEILDLKTLALVQALELRRPDLFE